MKNFQYNALRGGEKVVITQGKQKGSVGVVSNTYQSSKITLDLHTLEPGATPGDVTVHYSKVELADQNGQPIIVPILDMTGREIVPGSWVVYSIGMGRGSHGLELGKVDEITAVGGLKIQRILQNGDKIANMQWYWNNREYRHIHDADRTITLPCDVSTMTTWVLKDFEDLKDQI